MKKKKLDLGKLAVFYSNYGVFFVLLIVFIGASLCTQNFLTANNILSVLNQNALTAILGCGMTMLLISGLYVSGFYITYLCKCMISADF